MGKEEEEEVVVGVVKLVGREMVWRWAAENGRWRGTEYILHMYGILKEYILGYMSFKKPLAYERFSSNVGQEEREYLDFLAQTVELNLSVLSYIPLQVLGSHPPSSRARHRNSPRSPTPNLPSILALYPTPTATNVHWMLEGSQLYEFSQSILVIDFFSKKG